MYFLLNDHILEIDQSRMMHPLDKERFSALSMDYISQLGREMFALDPNAHRTSPDRAKRLCYLISLKLPRVNAASFANVDHSGGPEGVEASFKSLNEIAMTMMFQQQAKGELNAQKVDSAVWHRMAA